MFPDLNYTLKRLVRGLTSEDGSVKEGLFLGLISVFRKFSKTIDTHKYLTLVEHETRTHNKMKQSEKSALIEGRVYSILAVIESASLEGLNSYVKRILDLL